MTARSRRTDIGVNCIKWDVRFLRYTRGMRRPGTGGCNTSDNHPDGPDTMTHDVNTAATDTQMSHRGSDLLGVVYLATAGVAMTAWIGGLIWGGAALVIWLIS
ncbi:hypothetical protein [Bradyrhizobium sp. RDM4]|uniref:hypothetical protein n=1 Tax=Bradyrhizobium sp. RDM4 TaxID=3378765 RepID=UPI0038FD3647